MRIHFLSKNLLKPERAKVEEYINKRLAYVERLLTEFDDDTVQCKITAEKFERKSACKVNIELALPKETLYCSEDDHTFPEAVDLATDKLILLTKKYLDRLHRRTIKGGRRPMREAFLEAEPLLREQAVALDKDAFFHKILPLASGLKNFINREVEQHQIANDIDPEELKTLEVIDETILTLFEQFSDKPMTLTLEQWFYQKALEVLKDRVSQIKADGTGKVRLDKKLPGEVIRDIPSHLAEDRLDFDQRDEKLVLRDIIPDTRLTNPEKAAELHEQKEFILKTLGKLSDQKREAFVLSALEGFSEKEISELQNRSIHTVGKDIRDTQKLLKIEAENEFA